METVDAPPGSDGALVAALAIGWVVSTIAFLVGMVATNRMHDRWMDGAR